MALNRDKSTNSGGASHLSEKDRAARYPIREVSPLVRWSNRQTVEVVNRRQRGGQALQAGPPFASSETRLLDGEAMEEPVAAGAAQIGLAAAPVRSARGMR